MSHRTSSRVARHRMPDGTGPKRQALAERLPVPGTLAAAALALCFMAFPIASAHAEDGGCPPGQALCILPAKPSGTPTPDPSPTKDPGKPSPTDPQPAPVVPVPPPVVAPPASAVSSAPAGSETATPAPTATPSTSAPAPSAATASPSTESNWNKPIDNGSKKATQAAVVVGKDDPGSDMGGLMAIMGGVLLVGLGGLAFALWSRNRMAGH